MKRSDEESKEERRGKERRGEERRGEGKGKEGKRAWEWEEGRDKAEKRINYESLDYSDEAYH